MQTLWCRMAQARGSCRCAHCLSTASALARRAGTTATTRPKYLTSSTLWYSGIFAAAATFDAGLKQQRRDQWTRAIAEVEGELGQPAPAERADTVEDRLQAVNVDGDAEDEDIFVNVLPMRKKAAWPTNTGDRLHVHRVAPESIYATHDRKERAKSRRLSPKKLETINLSIDMLQLKLFLHLRTNGLSEAAAASVPTGFGSKMLKPLEELNDALASTLDDLRRLWKADDYLTDYRRSTSDLGLSNFFPIAGKARDENNQQLNFSLQRLFTQARNQYITTPALLAKICYNLCVIPAPPDLETYNTLLLGFADCQPWLVKHVIRSIRESHIRPNEVTLSGILNHYTKTDCPEGFVYWVEIMRGKHSGLALARPDIVINESAKGRLIHKEGDLPGKIIQLPYPTPMVFAALVAGVLKFSGFGAALSVCQGMGQEGWGLCMSGLSPLLHDCTARGDWTSGLAVWQQIKALEAKSRSSHREESAREKVRLETYASMLRLCSMRGHEDMFQEVWAQATRSHRLSIRKLTAMVKTQARLPTFTITRYLHDLKVDPNNEVGSDPLTGEQADRPPFPSSAKPPSADNLEHSDSLEEQAIVRPPNNFNDSKLPDDDPSQPRHSSGRRDSETPPQPSPADEEVSSYTASPDDEPQRPRLTVQVARARAPPELLRGQLDGFLPPSHELDDYEVCERPMTILAP